MWILLDDRVHDGVTSEYDKNKMPILIHKARLVGVVFSPIM